MKRTLIWLALGLGLLLVGYAFFASKTDEEIIEEQLTRLAAAVSVSPEENPLTRAARLNGEFSELFTRDATASVPELSAPVQGRRELLALATRAAAGFRTLDVAFSNTSVEVGNAAAEVKTTATLSGVRSDGDLDRGKRAVSLRFTRSDGDWWIASANVSDAE
ncbi:MAG TPA: nuclear transport factor 2 family protein [Polyangiaceae bacterium]